MSRTTTIFQVSGVQLRLADLLLRPLVLPVSRVVSPVPASLVGNSVSNYRR